MTLLSRIQSDLFDFTDHDPDDYGGLLEFWYQANSPALSAALTSAEGLTLIVNIDSFAGFEHLAKKLFLVADTLVLRDTRKWTKEETGFRSIPIPTKEYRPGYLDDVADELQQLRPSPLTLLYRPNLYWSSTAKTLNNGLHVAYAGWNYNSIPEQFVEWISRDGRNYLKTGKIVYAPFIPSLEMELEFAKNGISLPDYFNAQPCFHQKYSWIKGDRLNALFSLKFPALDGVDIETIQKIKQDHQDEFEKFSKTLLSAIGGVKSSFGTEAFLQDVRYIQEHQINAAVSDVDRTVSKIKRSDALRKSGLLVGLVGLNAAAYLGAGLPWVVSGLSASGAGMVLAKLEQLKDEDDLRHMDGYFLWKLGQ